jgi:hypothetical protein
MESDWSVWQGAVKSHFRGVNPHDRAGSVPPVRSIFTRLASNCVSNIPEGAAFNESGSKGSGQAEKVRRGMVTKKRMAPSVWLPSGHQNLSLKATKVIITLCSNRLQNFMSSIFITITH